MRLSGFCVSFLLSGYVVAATATATTTTMVVVSLDVPCSSCVWLVSHASKSHGDHRASAWRRPILAGTWLSSVVLHAQRCGLGATRCFLMHGRPCGVSLWGTFGGVAV